MQEQEEQLEKFWNGRMIDYPLAFLKRHSYFRKKLNQKLHRESELRTKQRKEDKIFDEGIQELRNLKKMKALIDFEKELLEE